MSLPLTQPPQRICILRLSAIGDICHALPVVRTLQQTWPNTELTWIIGKTEYSMVHDIPGIRFVVFDKRQGWKAYRDVSRQLQGIHFDVLLHMQMSLRASVLSALINARIKLGFDRQRAKDLQWLFTNHKIPYQPQQHVMDSFFGFSEALGIKEHHLHWNIPVSQQDVEFVSQRLPQPYVVISPCSSMAYRNWTVEGYSQVAQHIIDRYGLSVVISGGPSSIEQHYAKAIAARVTRDKLVNLVGQTSLKQLLAVLEQALCVIAPDSGPAHMATAVQTPVIGLYATTNPDRARPYLCPELVVSHYPQAVLAKYHKPVAEVPWGARVRDAGTMERISAHEVIAKVDTLLPQQLAALNPNV